MEALVVDFIYSQRGQKMLVLNDFKFKKRKVLKNARILWSCATSRCGANCHTDENGDNITLDNGSHNHGCDLRKLSRDAINNSCKRKATEDICERPSKIINLEVANSSYKENLTSRDIELIRHNICRNRQQVSSRTPRTIAEVHDVIKSQPPLTDRQELFVLENDAKNNIIIFGCKTNLKCLADSGTYYMDGTFKYSSKFFYQLFTIHCLRNGNYIPVIFCLLPNKHSSTYCKVLQHISSISANFNLSLCPSSIVVDFESAIHTAIKTIWPTANIFGCRFHLAQAWYRKIQNLGLASVYRQTPWLQHLFGLPFLHPERVGDCFVNYFMAEMSLSSCISKLADYLVDTYISENATFPPSLWASNSSHLHLTTNPCESFHSHFSDYFYHTHPNINVFLATLLRFQTSVYIKIQSLNDNPPIKKKSVRQAELFVQQKLHDLDIGKIDEYEFVKLVAHRYKV